jgi:hypothetical protein
MVQAGSCPFQPAFMKWNDHRTLKIAAFTSIAVQGQRSGLRGKRNALEEAQRQDAIAPLGT